MKHILLSALSLPYGCVQHCPWHSSIELFILSKSVGSLSSLPLKENQTYLGRIFELNPAV